MKERVNREERLAALEDAIEALAEASDAHVACLVEGDKDEAALRALGLEGPVVKVHAGTNLFAFVEAFARDRREAVLLVDWDERGGRLAKRLREACRANQVTLHEEHRLAIARATRGELRTVESIPTYWANLREAVRDRRGA